MPHVSSALALPLLLTSTFVSSAVFAAGPGPADGTAAVKEPDFLEMCLQGDEKTGPVLTACEMESAVLRENGRKDSRNFRAARRGCELGSVQSCRSLLFDVEEYQPKELPEALHFLESNCGQPAHSACGALADYHEEKGDFSQALKYAKRDYERHGTEGYSYPWLLYRHGDKKLAFRLSLQECEKDHTRCTFLMRYMPDHPQYFKLVSYSEQSCREPKFSGSGATDCNITGSFFYKKGYLQRAHELWWLDCNRSNPAACLLLLGSNDESTEEKNEAALRFCNMKVQGTDFDTATLRAQNCGQIQTHRRAPAAVIEYSVKLLKGYLAEQK